MIKTLRFLLIALVAEATLHSTCAESAANSASDRELSVGLGNLYERELSISFGKSNPEEVRKLKAMSPPRRLRSASR